MADITGMFQDPNAIRQARIDDIARQYQNTAQMGGSMNQLLGQVAASGSNVGSLMAEGAAGMFGMTTPEEAKAQKVQGLVTEMQDISDGVFDFSTPENIRYFAKRLNDLGLTSESIKALDYAKQVELGGDSKSIYGTEKEIKDSQGNIYKVRTRATANGYEPMYVAVTPNAPAVPVGAVEILGAYGETSAERIGRDVGTASQKEDAKLWSKMRGAAVEKFSEARSAISTINSALDLANKVATGGKVQEIAREMERLTGTMPADKGELIYLLNENILKQLKPTFGAQFTAKEGEWLARIMPNENDSNAVLVRKLNRIKQFTQDKAAQQMSLLKSKTYDDYTESLTSDGSLSWIDSDLSATATSGVPTKRFNPATGKIEVITEGK
jgi:hypothetical protein